MVGKKKKKKKCKVYVDESSENFNRYPRLLYDVSFFSEARMKRERILVHRKRTGAKQETSENERAINVCCHAD